MRLYPLLQTLCVLPYFIFGLMNCFIFISDNPTAYTAPHSYVWFGLFSLAINCFDGFFMLLIYLVFYPKEWTRIKNFLLCKPKEFEDDIYAGFGSTQGNVDSSSLSDDHSVYFSVFRQSGGVATPGARKSENFTQSPTLSQDETLTNSASASASASASLINLDACSDTFLHNIVRGESDREATKSYHSKQNLQNLVL